MFNEAKCDLCGDCLTRCFYVDYDGEKAVKEISLLIHHGDAEILKKCITCVACNEYCENGAMPFDLISELQEKFGSLVIPERTLNWFSKLSAMPSAILEGDPNKPALSICTMEPTLPPGTLESSLFEGMKVAKGGDFFCFIGAIHIGKETAVKDNARRFVDSIARLDSKEVVFIHDDCYAMVSKAREYGIDIPFKAIHIIEYLLSYLAAHREAVVKLNKRIAYQRPCASRYSTEKEPSLDQLFEIIGVERMKRRYDRTAALCCGGLFSRIMPEKVKWFQEMNLEDAKKSRAQALVFLCPLCIMSLKGMCNAHGLQSVLLTDLCRMALGEIPLAF